MFTGMEGVVYMNCRPIDAQDNQGNTPLHLACKSRKIGGVKVLLEYNANPNIQNNLGLTPLDIAVINQDNEMIELLLAKVKSVNTADNHGHHAEEHNDANSGVAHDSIATHTTDTSVNSEILGSDSGGTMAT